MMSQSRDDGEDNCMCDMIKDGMNKDKISIIIPVYNISIYLDAAMESIIHQTYKNMEIILVDDGSTDGSSLICDKWEKKDCRIKCIHQKNAGVSAARNTGFGYSTGDYILFVDGDDEIAPDMCEKMLYKLQKDHADVCYCGFLNIFHDKTLQVIPESKILEKNSIIWELVTEVSFFTAIWNKLFRREVLIDINGSFIPFPEGICVGEDALWLSRVLKNAKRVTSLSKALYSWKRREDSATQGNTNKRTDAKYLTVLDAYKSITEELENASAKKIMCKKYLGICRDIMVQAYKEKLYSLSEQIQKRIFEDGKMYKTIDLFYLKLNICTILVKIRIPAFVIELIARL